MAEHQALQTVLIRGLRSILLSGWPSTCQSSSLPRIRKSPFLRLAEWSVGRGVIECSHEPDDGHEPPLRLTLRSERSGCVLIGRGLCRKTVIDAACGVGPIDPSSQRGKMSFRTVQLSPPRSRRFVTPSVFESRLTSRSRLVRSDDHQVNALGLLDLETGDHILVSHPDWLKYNERHREATVPA